MEEDIDEDTGTDPTRLRETVIDGARLLAELEGVSQRDGAADRAGAAVELAMFYGRAFENVIAALPAPGGPPPGSVRLLHEAILGRAVFRGWQNMHTRVAEQAILGRMAGHWAKIVALVLVG